MSQNHVPAVALTSSPAITFLDQFGAFAGKNELALVLRALEVPNQHAVVPVAASILWLLKDVPWLGEHLGRRLPLDELVLALRKLTAEGEGEMPETHGNTLDFWATLALTSPHEADLAGLSPLAAVLLIAVLDAERGVTDMPPRKTIEELARTIRAISDQGPEHPHRGTLLDVRATTDLPDFAAALKEVLDASNTGSRSDFHRAWCDQVAPWLSGLPRKASTSPIRPPEPSPPQSSKSKPQRSRPAFQPTKSLKDTLGPTDGIAAPEPRDEAATTVTYISAQASKSARKRRRLATDIDRGFAWQRIRSENQFLHPGHISCLSAPEQGVIVPPMKAEWERSINAREENEASACASYLLSKCTGLTVDRVGSIPIVTCDHPRTKLDKAEIVLHLGVLRIAVLRDPDAFTPGPEHGNLIELLEPSADYLELPLPPSVVSLLRRHHSIWPCQRLGSALTMEGAEASVRVVLEKVCKLPSLSRSLGRARRMLASAVFEKSEDVAVPMLTCADTFGFSTSPLFYFGPKVTAIQQVYQDVTWPWFGDVPSAAPPSASDHRVGTRGLVRADVLQRGIRQIYQRLDFKAASGSSEFQQLVDEHNQLVNAALFHFCLIALARPTNSLFELTRFDIDLAGRMAVVWDKQVDAAHLFRLVFITEALARQTEALIAHLEALSTDPRMPDWFRRYARDAVEGSAPLFQFIDPIGEKLRGDVETWRTFWPEAWAPLSEHLPNFFRHAGATYLRESGVPGWVVSLQLGHLEAACWPLGSSSAVRLTRVATDFAERAAPYESTLGLRCRLGRGTSIPTKRVRPLRAWDSEIEDAAKRRREVEHERALQLRASQAATREAAEQIGRTLLGEHFPALLATIDKTKASDDPRPAERVEFRHEHAVQLTQLIEQLDQRPAIRVSVHNQICEQIRATANKLKLQLADINLIHVAPQPEPTPLFPRMMEARDQVLEIRGRLHHKHTPVPLSALTRAVIALTCIARIQDRARILSVLRNARSARLLPAHGLHLVVPAEPAVPTNSNEETLEGLQGAAAVALAGFSKNAAAREPINEQTISQALARELPDLLPGASATNAFHLLLRTVRVANILELPGVVRHAISDRGSVGASAALQLAWMQGKTPPAAVSESEAQASDHIDDRSESDPPPAHNPKAFRTRLSKALSLEERPEPGKGEKKGSIAVTRDDMRARLVLLKQELPTNPINIEYALVVWSIELIDNGTPLRKKPEPSTISTYVRAIHEEVLSLFKENDLRSLEPDDFSSRYLAIVEAGVDEASNSRTAAQLIHFHRFLERRFGLERADLADLAIFTAIGDRQVTADASSDAEYEKTRAWMARGITISGPRRLRGHRRRRRWVISKQIFSLLYATGMRLKEAALLRHSDIALCGSDAIVFVRPSYYRKLKTRAARRVLDLRAMMRPEDLEEFRRWTETERRRLGSDLRPNSLLFASVEDPRVHTKPSVIRTSIRRAFEGAGCRSLWPHLLRHGWVHRHVISAWSEASEFDDPGGWSAHRRLQNVSLQIGHAQLATTISCYFHCPWWLLAASQNDSAEVNRNILPVLANLEQRTVDQLKLRAPRKRVGQQLGEAGHSWTGRILARSCQLAATTEPSAIQSDFSDFTDEVLDLAELDLMLRQSNSSEEFAQLGWIVGLTKKDVDAIEVGISALADRTSVRLLSRSTRLNNLARTPPPRRLRDCPASLGLARLEHLSDSDLEPLLQSFQSATRATGLQRLNAFSGPREQLEAFSERLEATCSIPLTIETHEKRGRSDNCIAYVPGQPSDGLSGFDLIVWHLGLSAVRHCASARSQQAISNFARFPSTRVS
ncbi:MAG: tyrosine-type recombinase/integrase [Panacagrimonas sp.]